MSWRPLLQGPLADRALTAARTMADELVELGQDASLATGGAGIALLYAYLDRIDRGREYEMLARCYLAPALVNAARAPLSPSLYRGASGVAWTAAHLQRQTDLTGAVEQTLAFLLTETAGPKEYGLTDGLVGYGVYARERYGDPAATVLLELVVDRLAESARRQPDGRCDLGMARGLPGVIALLAAAVRLGANAGKARSLLDGAVRWLLAQRPKGPTAGRSGWCHGDPGIAAALLLAARAAGEPEWEQEAVAVARLAAGRPPAETGVADAAFCHGAAGLAHIFNRLWQATGDRELGAAARFWVEQTLALPRLAGNGLLRGTAGVALSLLAAATDVEPAWDRIFLLS